MPYTSKAFARAETKLGHALPVLDPATLAKARGWRTLSLIRGVNILAFILSWVLFALIAFFVALFSFVTSSRYTRYAARRNNPRPKNDPLKPRDRVLSIILSIFCSINSQTSWNFFWGLYFLYGDLECARQDYTEALLLQDQNPPAAAGSAAGSSDLEAARQSTSSSSDGTIINTEGALLTLKVLLNGTESFVVPFGPTAIDDRCLLERMLCFYRLKKAEGGIFGAASLHTLGHIEVVKVEGDVVVGYRDSIMDLGRDRDGRSIYLLDHLDKADGDDKVRELIDRGVLVPADEGQPSATTPTTTSTVAVGKKPERRALNFVSTRDIRGSTAVVATPLTFAVAVAVAWIVVAVRVYSAEFQLSVQTGIAVAAFIGFVAGMFVTLSTWLEDTETKNRSHAY